MAPPLRIALGASVIAAVTIATVGGLEVHDENLQPMHSSGGGGGGSFDDDGDGAHNDDVGFGGGAHAGGHRYTDGHPVFEFEGVPDEFDPRDLASRFKARNDDQDGGAPMPPSGHMPSPHEPELEERGGFFHGVPEGFDGQGFDGQGFDGQQFQEAQFQGFPGGDGSAEALHEREQVDEDPTGGRSPYDVLGVDPSASLTTIEEAFRAKTHGIDIEKMIHAADQGPHGHQFADATRDGHMVDEAGIARPESINMERQSAEADLAAIPQDVIEAYGAFEFLKDRHSREAFHREMGWEQPPEDTDSLDEY